MNPCLNAMEARLTDLLHTGLDTGAVDSAADFRRLAERCEACGCLLYTSPSPRDKRQSRMPSSA